jgi:hypothetical protein
VSIVHKDEEEEEKEEGDDDRDNIELNDQLLQSPGGVSQASQMPGTTGITSASSTHSVDEINKLDPMMVEFLPDLLESSRRILDLLAPRETSTEVVESIVRELKVLGSLWAKRLRHAEDKFRADRVHYGSHYYIDPSVIHRALFGKKDVHTNLLRQHSILHAANLATLLKDIFVMPQENSMTLTILQGIDTIFPDGFLRGFDDVAEFGNSRLLDETFELALEIRTQAVIAYLLTNRGTEDLDHEQSFLAWFYFLPKTRQISPQISYFDDVLEHGQVKNLVREIPMNSKEHAKIQSRLKQMRIAFQPTDDSDLVDFELLEMMFPWTDFLTQLAQWCRMRLDEIMADIKPPEGVNSPVKSLIETVKESNSQVELHDPPSLPVIRRQPALTRTIVPSTAGQK